MKTSKKLLSVLLMMLLVISFAACSKDEKIESPDPSEEICEECGENKAKKDGLCKDCLKEETDEEMCEECGENKAKKDGLCKDCMKKTPEEEMCKECGDNEATEDGLCEECIYDDDESDDEAIEELVDSFVRAISAPDGEEIFNCSYWALLSEEDFEELSGMTYFEMIDELEKEFEDVGKVRYEICDIDYYDQSELDNLNANAPAEIEVKAAASVEVEFYKNDATSEIVSITVGMDDGQWYIIDI